jgi:spore maturation protein CgeB
MKIAYIGPSSGTSLHRAHALERLGHQVSIIDPWSWLGRSKWTSRWLYHMGGVGVGLLIDQPLYQEVSKAAPDLIWVNQGEFIGPKVLCLLRTTNAPIINYLNDDPFGGHDKRRFSRFLQAVSYYDLIVIPREENISEAKEAGAREVMRIRMSADEIAHAPRRLTVDEQQYYASEVAFIGTWMPERGSFMAELIDRGVPLSIWGDRWQKAPEAPILGSHWRGHGLFDGLSYSAAILAAKICLGLLSKGNRDLHTRRSLEIPALGGLLCAEWTLEHQALYEQGVEAVFWKDAAECADICKDLLANEERRKKIAQAGHERALRNNFFNEPVLASIIERVMGRGHSKLHKDGL